MLGVRRPIERDDMDGASVSSTVRFAARARVPGFLGPGFVLTTNREWFSYAVGGESETAPYDIRVPPSAAGTMPSHCHW